MKLSKNDLIFVTGHRGMVGSGIVRRLHALGYERTLTAGREDLDLCQTASVEQFFAKHRPDVVVHAAARVGGIKANMDAPAEFLRDNVLMNVNVIHAAAKNGTRRLCFLGSSCIYPRECPQPMQEESLLTGPLEPTNEGYALAKIAGLRYAEYCHRQYGLDAFSVMPCNLYGTNDHFDLAKSHVITALVKRFCDAVDRGDAVVTAWGTGSARREFLHVDDAAAATVMLLERYEGNDFINIGPGDDVTIRELSELVARLAGFEGRIEWDASKPDGMPRKCLDVSRLLALGFRPAIGLEAGVAQTIAEYRELQRKGQA
jgi:GDP-L-fucose synthase